MAEGEKALLLNVHLSHERGKTVLQWVFKLNTALTIAETWQLNC
jgi:hypothetical protein